MASNIKGSWTERVWNISPPWLRGKWGTPIMAALFGVPADIVQLSMTRLAEAVLDWRRISSLPDALDLIGMERRLPRYPLETNEQYRERLANAWTIYAQGPIQAMVQQLGAAGFPGAIVERKIELLEGTLSDPSHGVFAIPHSDDYWSQFAVVIPYSPSMLGTTPGWKIGDGTKIGDPGAYIGPMSDLYSIRDMKVIRSIIDKWKPANWVCSVIVFLSEDATTELNAPFEDYLNNTTPLWGYPGTELWLHRVALRPAHVDEEPEEPDEIDDVFWSTHLSVTPSTQENRDIVTALLDNYTEGNSHDAGEGVSAFYFFGIEWPEDIEVSLGQNFRTDTEGDMAGYPDTRYVFDPSEIVWDNELDGGEEDVYINIFSTISPDTEANRDAAYNVLWDLTETLVPDVNIAWPDAATLKTALEADPAWPAGVEITITDQRRSDEDTQDLAAYPDVRYWAYGFTFDTEWAPDHVYWVSLSANATVDPDGEENRMNANAALYNAAIVWQSGTNIAADLLTLQATATSMMPDGETVTVTDMYLTDDPDNHGPFIEDPYTTYYLANISFPEEMATQNVNTIAWISIYPNNETTRDAVNQALLDWMDTNITDGMELPTAEDLTNFVTWPDGVDVEVTAIEREDANPDVGGAEGRRYTYTSYASFEEIDQGGGGA